MRCCVTPFAHAAPELFRAAYIDYDDSGSLQRWVITKVSNAVALLAAMVAVNDYQKIVFDQVGGSKAVAGRMRTTIDRCIRSGMFNLVDSLVPKILGELESIARTADKIGVDSDRLGIAVEAVAEKLLIKL
jgi:hypothetical protein